MPSLKTLLKLQAKLYLGCPSPHLDGEIDPHCSGYGEDSTYSWKLEAGGAAGTGGEASPTWRTSEYIPKLIRTAPNGWEQEMLVVTKDQTRLDIHQER